MVEYGTVKWHDHIPSGPTGQVMKHVPKIAYYPEMRTKMVIFDRNFKDFLVGDYPESGYIWTEFILEDDGKWRAIWSSSQIYFYEQEAQRQAEMYAERKQRRWLSERSEREESVPDKDISDSSS